MLLTSEASIFGIRAGGPAVTTLRLSVWGIAAGLLGALTSHLALPGRQSGVVCSRQPGKPHTVQGPYSVQTLGPFCDSSFPLP